MRFDKGYWNSRWLNKETKWDIGFPSPCITKYIDSLENKDIRILIPGCGNAYEATYLINNGFTDITLIDISAIAVAKLKQKIGNQKNCKILCQDFFSLHNSDFQFDLILEQTFFCALQPNDREKYVDKMWEILSKNGRLIGLLFNYDFGNSEPPFGGDLQEYKVLFEKKFEIQKMEMCYNSIPQREGNELFINFLKK